MIPLPAALLPRLAAVALAAALLAALLVLGQCRRAGTAQTSARLAASQAGAASASGHDAVQRVGTVQSNEMAIDAIGRENENAIDRTEGARGRVADDARTAGVHALCRRTSYRQRHAECVQQPAP